MKTICFENISRVPGKITFDVRHEGGEDSIYFELPDDVRPKYTEIAVVMALMAGQSFEEIRMDLPVDPLAGALIERWTKAKLIRSGEEIYNRNTGDKVLLNFSGGFDSLAARGLLPEDALMTSTRFLGNYDKEWEFFRQFDTSIVTTNLREHGYNLNSDAFMGAGACLLKSSLGAEYVVSGDIFETYSVAVAPELREKEIFQALGFTVGRYTEAMTEVGSTMAAAHFYPELLEKSLSSLAAPGTEKYHRKTSLLRIVRSRFNKDLPDIPVVRCDEPVPFGKWFYSDFLALYELKYLGWQEAEARVSGIPEEAVQLSERLKLDFYERLNPDALFGFRCDKDREYFLDRAKEAGLKLFEENDLRELEMVKEFLLRNRDRYMEAMREKLDRKKEHLAAVYLARIEKARKLEERLRKQQEQEKLRNSASEPEGLLPSDLAGDRIMPGENRIIDVDAGSNKFMFHTLVKNVLPGIYALELEDIELSGTGRFTVAVYNTDPKLRVLEKTFTKEDFHGLVLKITNSENMRLLIYPNVPGETQGCRMKAKVKSLRCREENV